jgi:hypothetical protein
MSITRLDRAFDFQVQKNQVQLRRLLNTRRHNLQVHNDPSRIHAKRGDVLVCLSIIAASSQPAQQALFHFSWQPQSKAVGEMSHCCSWFCLMRLLIGSGRFRYCVRQRACLGSRSAQFHLVESPRRPCSTAAPSALEPRT